MALERIEAWLGVRDAQRFQRDMNQSADSIKKLRKESQHLNQSGVTLAQGFGGLRVGLGQYTALAFGALPVVMGLAGAFGALASSAGAASVGAIALGIGVGGVLLPSLLGTGIVAGKMAGDFNDIQTSLEAYQLSVKAFGRDSQQAETALRRLSGVVDEQGGVKMLRAVRMWQRLGDQFDSLTAPGRDSVGGIMTQGLEMVQRMLPTFARTTNQGLASIESNAASMFDTFGGGEARGAISDLGDSFAKISGPLMRAFTSGIMFLLRVARASIPYVEKLAFGVEDFGNGLDRASEDPAKLGATIGELVSHTTAWWNLFKEVGLLVVTVMGASATEGRSFVLTLTDGVRALREMAGSAQGQKDIAGFMKDSVRETKAFGIALWSILEPLLELARDAMPLWTDILQANAVGLTNVFKLVLWLSNILEPLGGLLGVVIVGFWGWKAAMLAWNIVFGVTNFLWRLFIANFWALNAAFYASPIGWIILAIIAVGVALYLAYTKVEWFRNAVHNTWNWIKDNWPLLLAILGGPFGLAAYFIIKHFDAIKDAGASVLQWIGDKISWVIRQAEKLNDKLGGVPGKIFGAAADVAGFLLPGMATGGTVSAGGLAVVGERGPEIARFAPGSAVAPLKPAAVAGRGTVRAIDPGAAAAFASHRTIVVPVQIDGREIGRVVAEDTDDRIARGPGED